MHVQTPSYTDLDVLATLLQHGSCVVSNAGTIVLDSLVNERPTVCVLYDEGAPPGESWAAKNALGEHYRQLMESGAFYRAHNFDEVARGIERALASPDELAEERRRVAQEVVGEVDGRAAERVVDAIVDGHRRRLVRRPVDLGATEWLFFATVFTVTFAKVHWAIGGDLSLSDVLTALFLVAFVDPPAGALGRALRAGRRRATFAFFVGVPARLPARLLQPRHDRGARPVGRRGSSSSCSTSSSSSPRRRSSSGGGSGSTGGRSARSSPASPRTPSTALLQLGGRARAPAGNLDAAVLSPLTGGASQINIYGAVAGQSVYRPNALTGDPNHLGIELTIPLLVLLPMYLRLGRGAAGGTPRCCCSRSCS